MRNPKETKGYVFFIKKVLYLSGLYGFKTTIKEMTAIENYAGDIISKFDTVICAKKLFLDPGFSIKKAAKEVGTNRTYLSRSINFKTGQNFYDFINNYRSEYARGVIRKSFLKDDGKKSAYKPISMAEVAAASGFSSLRALNRYHVKKYGVLPSEYKNDILTGKCRCVQETKSLQ